MIRDHPHPLVDPPDHRRRRPTLEKRDPARAAGRQHAVARALHLRRIGFAAQGRVAQRKTQIARAHLGETKARNVQDRLAAGDALGAFQLHPQQQLAFIGALSPAALAHGWDKLSFTGASGPFAGLASLMGATWLAALLYIDSVVSPAGIGVIYFTTTARVVYASGQEGLIGGRAFARLSVAGVPVAGLVLTLIVGVFFMFPFPSWQKIVGFISSASVLSYGIGPLVLMTLRRTLPIDRYRRPYLLAGGPAVATLAFVISNFIIFWSGAATDDFLFGAILAFVVVYVGWEALFGVGLSGLHWAPAWWLAPYFVGMWLITYLGPVGLTGGTGVLSVGSGAVVLTLFSLAIIALALRAGIPEPEEARATILAGEPELLGPVG